MSNNSIQLLFKDYSLTIKKELLISIPYFKNYFERWDESNIGIIDFSDNDAINQFNFLYILFQEYHSSNYSVYNDYNYFNIDPRNRLIAIKVEEGHLFTIKI